MKSGNTLETLRPGIRSDLRKHGETHAAADRVQSEDLLAESGRCAIGRNLQATSAGPVRNARVTNSPAVNLPCFHILDESPSRVRRVEFSTVAVRDSVWPCRAETVMRRASRRTTTADERQFDLFVPAATRPVVSREAVLVRPLPDAPAGASYEAEVLDAVVAFLNREWAGHLNNCRPSDGRQSR